MSRHLFKIEWVIVIPERGVLLTPGVLDEEYVKLKPGDKIELRKPDDTTILTEISSFYIVSRASDQPPTQRNWHILLPPDIHADSVPIGTNVWLVGDWE